MAALIPLDEYSRRDSAIESGGSDVSNGQLEFESDQGLTAAFAKIRQSPHRATCTNFITHSG